MSRAREPTSVIVLDGRTMPSRSDIGGKAWSIANMMHLGLRVPPAVVVTTQANAKYRAQGELSPSLIDEIMTGIRHLETASQRKFGGTERPLLVSVRSGAAVSMPGMMDTVLNLGINDEVEQALAIECGDKGFAQDTHKRFLHLFSSIVLRTNLPERGTGDAKTLRRRMADNGEIVPVDPFKQLLAAVEAVFQSWESRRAKRYRDYHGISHDLGTAVTIQAMIFGNLNERSGTGVLFSRNPLTGERQPYGEFLHQAQGEDVVSGRFTPQPLESMCINLPAVHDELLRAGAMLEEAANEVQDIEFTVEDGKLFILQSRAAKLSPLAAAKTSVDFVKEGRITPDAALKRVSPDRLRQLLSPTLEGVAVNLPPIARGEGACPGVGIGVVVTDADSAEERIRRGEPVVLARPTTSPNDLHGMIGASAVVTEEGGSTSHAAVVSRALGVPCVVGCGSGSLMSLVGRTVTVDGQNGLLFDGALPVQRTDERRDPILGELLTWATERSPIRVLRPSEIDDLSVLDLSTDEEGCDAQSIDAALTRQLVNQVAAGAKGGAIATDEGVRAAIRHRLKFIVADPTLPALVAAAVAAANQDAF